MSEKKSPKYFSQKAKKKKSVVVILEKKILEIFSKVGKNLLYKHTFWPPRGGEKYMHKFVFGLIVS